MSSPVHVYHIVVSKEKVPERSTVHKIVTDYAKAFVYQLEQGDGGFLHWDIKVSLIKKRRLGEIAKILHEAGLVGCHVSIMSKAGLESAYSRKVDTRVEGPWTDKDKKPRYVQERFRKPVPWDWQTGLCEKLVKMLEEKNDRNILIKVDNGNEGKSWFKGWMMATRDDVIILPASLRNPGEMIEYICSLVEDGWKGIILMDVPRATSFKHWGTLAAGLETIKQGFLYDHRYKGKMVTIEPPQICCFMNEAPPSSVMTSDVFIKV